MRHFNSFESMHRCIRGAFDFDLLCRAEDDARVFVSNTPNMSVTARTNHMALIRASVDARFEELSTPVLEGCV